MERVGLRFFQRLSKRYPHNFSPDEIHVLNPQERAGLRKIQRNTVIRAGIAGAISAGLSVLAGVLLLPLLEGQEVDPPWELYIPYFLGVTGITIAVTVLEIMFLYWDALRSVYRLSATAGLELFPAGTGGDAVATALVRAALELPNPPDDIEGVNPRREISKIRVIIGTLVYKLKATATNFLIKAIVRKIVGRSGFRAWMEITAVPVFAFWNGLITWWVLRQARIRAMGPSAVTEFSRLLFATAGNFSVTAREQSFRAVGAAVVRTVDVHPNLVAMMAAMHKHLGDPGDIVLDDSELFLDTLQKMQPNEQEMVLKILVIATIIDGKLQGRERKLLREAYELCGFESDLAGAKRLRKAFVSGYDIADEVILNCLPPRIK